MPKYRYTAVTLENKRVTDTLDARDESELKRILMNRDLVPIRFIEIENELGSRAVFAGIHGLKGSRFKVK